MLASFMREPPACTYRDAKLCLVASYQRIAGSGSSWAEARSAFTFRSRVDAGARGGTDRLLASVPPAASAARDLTLGGSDARATMARVTEKQCFRCAHDLLFYGYRGLGDHPGPKRHHGPGDEFEHGRFPWTHQ